MRQGSEMEMVKVTKVRKEAKGIMSVLFRSGDPSRWGKMIPGQFLMVWIPGVDEVPMSVSYLQTPDLGITVQDIGTATNALCSLEKGDMIGIRGPYGNGFPLPERERISTVIGVSGGVGGASTILPMEWVSSEGFRTVNLLGARDRKTLLFEDRFGRSSDLVRISTDDGSAGHHGFVTDLLQELLSEMDVHERSRTMIFTCGPEMMMQNVKRITDSFNVEANFSLERFMKCGIGVCDSCSVSGKRVCMDGPVFTSQQINGMDEFGESHRTRSGRSVPLRECVR